MTIINKRYKMRIRYFLRLFLILFLTSFTSCNIPLNNEYIYAKISGEYQLIGFRLPDEWIPFSEKYYTSIIYAFNGTNKAEVISNSKNRISSYYIEFEMLNGKYRHRVDFSDIADYLEQEEIYGEWDEWQKFNFNDDYLEIEIIPNSDVYAVYKKLK
jgi:hypothetical protein